MATELAYAPPMKAGKEGFQGTPELQHRIRITLSSKSVKNLEKGMHLHPPSTTKFFLFSFPYISARLC
jgi:hypothetical protein